MPITDLQPHDVRDYVNEEWDVVITVCDHARESCPVFTGAVRQRLHISFPDPAQARGTTKEQLVVFNEVRDSIIHTSKYLYRQYL